MSNKPAEELLKPKITIFGVGGAGGNAINNMIKAQLEGVEFVAANTDAQSLKNSVAENKIQLGAKTTKGLGAGSFPDKGKESAEENVAEIEEYLEGNNMVFIAAGMGGGTGTGAAPVIAKLAKERDILTVGVVTKPFHFEGKYRMEIAEEGIEELKKHVDTLIVIPNQNLFRIANENTTFESAFKMADDVLHAGVRGVTDLITMPGLVNLDFADIRTVMTKMGKAMMGTGEAEGENRAIAACEAAISNPLLDDISIAGAKGVLVNMTGGPDMTLFEADMAVNAIKKEVDENANIIFGSAFNEDMKGKIRISVVATGIDLDESEISNNSVSNEPSRFNIDESNQSFFDPGEAMSVENESIDKITNDSFESSSQEYLSEPNEDYGKEENSDDISQVSFFGDDDNNSEEKINIDDIQEEEPEEQIIEEEEEEIIVEDKKQKKDKKAKKEGNSSGFSLFSFMNSSKESSQEAKKAKKKEKEDKKKNKAEAKKEAEKQEEKPKSATKEKKSIIQNMKFDEDKVEEANKKKNEFFNKKDNDDELVPNEVEDDILNVPAFFRRKK